MRPICICFSSLFSLLLLFSAAHAGAQTCPTTTVSDQLVCVIPQLYGPGGLVLPNTHHAAHFRSASLQNFAPLNTAIGQALSTLPLASPGTSIIFKFNPSLGVVSSSQASLGPILSERAETVGRHSFYLGGTYQFFTFSSLDGIDLKNLPAEFKHVAFPVGGTTPQFENDWIQTRNSIDLKVHQVTLFGTFGLTSRVDVSVAIPILDVRMGVTSQAHIVRTDPCELSNTCTGPFAQSGNFHFFDANDPLGSTDAVFSNKRSAAGIGDVVFRIKGVILSRERWGFAGGIDVRTPTGNEENFLGSGAVGVKPFLALSARGRVSPHVNIAYQWNGQSILAGNVLTGRTATLPDQFFYYGGLDIGVTNRLTLVADYLGQRVFGASRLRQVPFTDSLGTVHSDISDIQSFTSDYNAQSIALGGKIRLTRKLLFAGNVLIRLDHGGLRANVVPLAGILYNF